MQADHHTHGHKIRRAPLSVFCIWPTLALVGALACESTTSEKPVLESLSPAIVPTESDTPVRIQGTQFEISFVSDIETGEVEVSSDFRLKLQDAQGLSTELGDMIYLDTQTLEVTIPAGLAPGNYSATLIGPVAQATPLEDALRVVSSGSVSTGEVMVSTSVGGAGGTAFPSLQCPDNQILYGLEGDFYLGTDDGAGFCKFKALCSEMALNADNELERVGEVSALPALPDPGLGECIAPPGTPQSPLLCPDGEVLVGLSTSTSGLFGAPTLLQLHCAPIDRSGLVGSKSTPADIWGQIVTGAQEDHILDCPDQSVATGIRGKSGVVVDTIQLECRSVSTGI